MNLANKYAQLIEATALAEETGHGRISTDTENCELCMNLFVLRRQVEKGDRLRVGRLIIERLNRRV